MTSQLSINTSTTLSYTSLPPPPAMSPRCEDCHRKESCMCDKEADYEAISEILPDMCNKCHQDNTVNEGLCMDCHNEEMEEEHEEEEEDEDDWPYKGNCEICGDDQLMCDNLCADCYWEEDSNRKHRRREFYWRNPDLAAAWSAHCAHVIYSQPIEVSDLLREHIPKNIQKDTPEYDVYLEKFRQAIKQGLHGVLTLLTEINPDYKPK